MVACAISSRFEAFRGPEALSAPDRILSDGRVDGVAVAWRRADAVAATAARSESFRRTPRRCLDRVFALALLAARRRLRRGAARFSASSLLRRSSSAFCCSSWAALPAPFLCERPFCASARAPAPSFFLTASGNVSRSHRSSSAPSTYSGSSSDSAQAGFPLMSAGGAAPRGPA